MRRRAKLEIVQRDGDAIVDDSSNSNDDLSVGSEKSSASGH